jgi:hypothetical protein
MHHAWEGTWPENRSPRMEGLYLDDRIAQDSIELEPGGRYPARATAADPDGDSPTYRWVLRRESGATQVGGDREEVPEMVPGRLEAGNDGRATLTAPEQRGAYRLFVYVYDGNGHAGHANIPFLVQ